MKGELAILAFGAVVVWLMIYGLLLGFTSFSRGECEFLALVVVAFIGWTIASDR